MSVPCTNFPKLGIHHQKGGKELNVDEKVSNDHAFLASSSPALCREHPHSHVVSALQPEEKLDETIKS